MWLRAFDLVVEIITVQALPDPPRRQAITNVGRLVAAEGTLLVVAAVADDEHPPTGQPPWPLRREEIEAFATDGLAVAEIEIVHSARIRHRTALASRTPPPAPDRPTDYQVNNRAAA